MEISGTNETSSYITTNDCIRDLLQQRLSTTNRHDHAYTPQRTMQLLQILGGIEQILKDYVSHSNDLLLTTHQLHQIHNVLNHNSSFTPIVTTNASDTDENGANICYEFSENDTYLHSIFGEENAIRILHVLHTKMVRFLMGSAAVGFMLLHLITNTLVYPVYLIVVSCVLWIPFFIIYYLSGNIRALKMILSSFEFWFKISYAVMYGSVYSIYVYHYGVTHGWLYPRLQLIAAICQLITVPMCVLNISSFDAYHISKSKKIFFSSVAASLFTFHAVYYSVLVSDSDDLIVYITPDNSISVASIISSTVRILAIFTWRQAILIILRSKKQKCVLIKYIPSVKWNLDTAISEVEIDKCATETTEVDVVNGSDSFCVECAPVDVIVTPTRKCSISITDSGCDNHSSPVLQPRLSTRL